MAGPAVAYSVRIADLHAHLFEVELAIAQPAASQLVSLPTWIPGSYLVREFSRNLQQLRAHQEGQALTLTQLDKCTWQVHCAANKPLVLNYQISAFDNSVRSAWLDTTRGFFNGTSLFLRVHGQERSAHALKIGADKLVPGWQLATGLRPVKVSKSGFGSYLAADYDELVDSPVELGKFWSGSFEACGVPHRFVVAGAPPGFDGQRLLADSQDICESAIRFWHRPQTGAANKAPHQNYVFMLNAVDDAYGGLEHRNSTALICRRKDLPLLRHPSLTSGTVADIEAVTQRSDGYVTLLGLISHEYFHTWNVKRLRPTEFAHYDYQAENYTRLLWFFEGFTSYYDDLLLRRAELIDDASYLKLLTKTINQVLQTPGRKVQSLAEASMDAWVKYYRQDENTVNATVSYYTKGSLVALCLDLVLRQQGKTSLDAVMRALWQRCAGGPMSEADLSAVLTALGAKTLSKELVTWVHATTDLPLRKLLEQQGVGVEEEPAGIAQQLGVVLKEGSGVHLKSVLRGSAAERAGLAAGDEWLALEVGSGEKSSCWRLSKIDDLLLYAGSASKVGALVARDKRIFSLALSLPKATAKWRLVARDAALVKQWLHP